MKKRTSALAVGTIILCLFSTDESHVEENFPPAFQPSEEFKVLVKFRSGQLTKETYNHEVNEITSDRIRTAFADYGLETMSSIFKNRFDERGHHRKTLSSSNDYYLEGWQQVPFAVKEEAEQFVARLKKEADIEDALIETLIEVQPALVPNDPQYLSNNQWHLNNLANQNADIDAEQAWDVNRGRNDVVIGVLDGGVDYTHLDLDPGNRTRIIAGIDTGDDDGDPMDNLSGGFAGHGTSIAGVIGAITNNTRQVSGVMWNCSIRPVKMVRSGGIRIPHIVDWNWDTSAFPSDVADAIDYAVNNSTHVINLSYSFPDMNWPINEVILRLPTLAQAIDNAYKNNVVITASMGNEFASDNRVRYPAGFREQVIAVGASTAGRARASFSNTGPHISVLAPGEGIVTTARGGTIRTVSGTSFSAPIAAGTAGLIISQGKDRNFSLTNDDVRHILELTAVDLPQYGTGFDNESGFGLINANNAVRLLNTPNMLFHYNSVGGTSTKIATLSQWIILDNRWGIAAGTYYQVDVHKITKRVNFDIPFCAVPPVWMRERESKSLNYTNPSLPRPHARIFNVTVTGFDLEYYAYYVKTNSLGQTINKWIPTAPASTNVAYTVVGRTNPAVAGDFPPNSCINSSQIFSVSNPAPGATYTWSVAPMFQIVGSNTGNSVTIRVAGNGTGSVQFTGLNSCGTSFTASKIVTVGIPSISVSTSDNRTGTTSYHTATATQLPGTVPSNYTWYNEVNGSPTTVIATGLVLSNWPVSPCSSKFYQLRVNTPCGVAVYRGYAYNPNGCGGFMYTAYPNPASEALTIEKVESTSDELAKLSDMEALDYINASNSSNQKSAKFDIALFNASGEKKISLISSADKVDVILNNLQDGNYVLKIHDGSRIITKHIKVKK